MTIGCVQAACLFFFQVCIQKRKRRSQNLNDLPNIGSTEQALHLANAVYAVPEQPDEIAELRELPKRYIDDLGW